MVIVKCTDVFREIFFVWGGEKLMGWGVTWEDLSMEEFVIGKENFNEGCAGFVALFKKKRKNKYEKFFFNLK